MDRVKADIPNAIFVSDQSSVSGARDLTKEGLYEDYGVIFSGVHKNFGTSGLAFALVRDDVMERVISNKKNAKIPIPKLMDWEVYAGMKDNSFVNTPSLSATFVTEATCRHFNKMGGIEYYENLALSKSKVIYDALDKSKLWKCDVKPELRSSMNQVFYANTGDKTLDKHVESEFIYQSRMAGFLGLAGHRHVGGLRSTVYNAVT